LPYTKARNDLHAVPIPAIYKKLGTRPEGLTEAEIKDRQNRFGRNRILRVKGKPLVLKLLANSTHLMALLLLWAGGAVGFIAKMPQLGLAIWTVNLINGVSNHQNTIITARPHPRIDKRWSLCPCLACLLLWI
jgi:magnesium-transporting ATPase (P-type)